MSYEEAVVEGHQSDPLQEDDGAIIVDSPDDVQERISDSTRDSSSADDLVEEPFLENNDPSGGLEAETELVSDISESTQEESSPEITDEWLNAEEAVGAEGGNDEEMQRMCDVAKRMGATMPGSVRRSFTICSVITNTSDHENSIRSQRENVDRLLMAETTPTGTSSLAGSDIEDGNPLHRNRSNSCGCMQMEPNVTASCGHTPPTSNAPFYDQNYYRAGDWLRFIPRRGSHHDNFSSSSSEPATINSMPMNFGYNAPQAGVPPPMETPDNYYRGFDNTRIRTGFHAFHGATTLKKRTLRNNMANNDDGILFPEYPTLPIHEEEGGLEKRESIGDSPSDLPKEIHCSQHDYHLNDVQVTETDEVDHKEVHREPIPSQVTDDAKTALTDPIVVLNDKSRPLPEEAKFFESSLRVGGIMRPPSPLEHIDHHHNGNFLSAEQQEQQMHIASWDSKYETYACRVDQSQEDRSVEIPLFSMARPHMRAFHFAWLTFFFAFLAWFAITPLLAEVQTSLDLTKEQIWTSSICSVAGAVVSRCLVGLFCDVYGARWMSAGVLFICGIPAMLTGLVNSSLGLSILRLFVGIGGSTFVTCQYWTSTMFTREVAGTANALAAGWGNLGGGVAQVFVGAVLFPLLKLIYSSIGTTMDPAELAWRTACIIPGIFCLIFTFIVIRYSDDSPKGNYVKRKRLGLMQKGSAVKFFRSAISDHNTWLLLIQYGCCFGVELTTSNAAALYFKEEFELSTEAAAAVASTFGWMNLFARGLGGFLSDVSNAYLGMRGRLIWQFVCFALEGCFVMVFSRAKTLAGAITALMTFSLFVQGAEGSTFGIVPYLNPSLTGSVSGIIGAGGNAGAVIFSVLFRQMDYRTAFLYMGASTMCVSILSCFVWIKGYDGLFLGKRIRLSLQEKTANAPQNTEVSSSQIQRSRLSNENISSLSNGAGGL